MTAITNNTYAFLRDYTQMISCLASIRQLELNGGFSNLAELLALLEELEERLKKLYNRATYLKIKYTGQNPSPLPASGLDGDFEEIDFYSADFYTSVGYAVVFENVISTLEIIKGINDQLSEEDRLYLDAALLPFLESFEALLAYLKSLGITPCATIEDEYFVNSPFISLQACGSTGQNGIAEGIHLRWSLSRALGENHIPQGTLNNSNSGTNSLIRPDDFVKLYRIPYTNPVSVKFDLTLLKPVVDNASKTWTYNLNSSFSGTDLSNTIKVTFEDSVNYNQAAAVTAPGSAPLDFLKQYNGIVKIYLYKKTAFSISLEIKSGTSGNGLLKAGVYTSGANEDIDEDLLTAQKTVQLDTGSTKTETILADNIRGVHISKSSNTWLEAITVETYHDFIITRGTGSWTLVGDDFGLSLDENTVFNRLEDNGSRKIDKLWPHFNGDIKVVSDNYREKWNLSYSEDDPSLKKLVEEYILYSRNDPKANNSIKLDDAASEEQGLVVSYLDVINLMATDFHIARMLGLGYIDNLSSVDTNERFIYKVVYTNRESTVASGTKTFEYLYLPTSKSDTRALQTPAIRPLTYTLSSEHEGTLNLFDENGYSKIDNVRVVNIGRALNRSEVEYEFNPDLLDVNDFNLSQTSRAVYYGVEYRNTNSLEYVKPEITAGKSFGEDHVYRSYDVSNPNVPVPEVIPVPDDINSLFVHFETNTGIHHYAIYGIDWFSRASALSDEVSTDATAFQPKNTLLPPADVSAHYIQEEDTLLFTTQAEQTWLAQRESNFPGKDNGFTRLVFNWLDITDISHLQNTAPADLASIVRADKLKVYFREQEPLEVKGLISRMYDVPGNEKQLAIYPDEYQLLDGTDVQPAIAPADFSRLSNSIISVSQLQFKVVEIQQSTPWPIIIIEKIVDTENVEDPEQPESFGSLEKYKLPEAGDKFSIVENLSSPGNWSPVSNQILIKSFIDAENPSVEITEDQEGNLSKTLIGGITGNSIISRVLDNANAAVEGYYAIEFVNAQLVPHTQVNDPGSNANNPDILQAPHVEWYKGLIRIPTAGNKEKLLEVVRIAETSPIKLYVYDPAFKVDEIKVSGQENTPISVNFHPGYRAYLFPEQNNLFKGDIILPPPGTSDKKSLIGLQAIDSATGSGFSSPVSLPAVIIARRIEKPIKPELPTALGLKVRADATYKAAFTFDLKINASRTPFGFAFFRVNQQDLLDALYAPQTVASILSSLESLTSDPFYTNRFKDLIHFEFNSYDAEPAAYAFPLPDKAGLVNANDSNEVKEQKYLEAIRSMLLPLTEQTPIVSFLKEGVQTDNKIPVIRTIDGNLLDPSHTHFDPFPMIRKFIKASEPGSLFIRFTDYTLNANSRNLYFYTSAEVTNQLTRGPLSPFLGPVVVLQTRPAPAPTIKKYMLITEGSENGIGLRFEISPYARFENISKIRIYRTYERTDALFLSTMLNATTADITAPQGTDITLEDHFDDLASPPYGKTIYYRLAAIRTISNETDAEEEIISVGSEILEIKIPDLINPEAPLLTHNAGNNTILWNATAYNASYFLYKQNNKGNWEKLSPELKGNGAFEFKVSETPLPVTDEDGDRVYHRFKVKVFNSSGLINLQDKELTV